MGTLTYLFALIRNSDPYLAKFKGKPGQLSPKARLLMFAGWLLPSRFKSVQFLPSSQPLFLTSENSSQTVPSHHSIDTTGSSTVQKQAKRSDTSSTTTPPLPSPMAAPCSVWTSGPPSIVSRGFRPVSAAGRRPGTTPRRERIKLERQVTELAYGSMVFLLHIDHIMTLPLNNTSYKPVLPSLHFPSSWPMDESYWV